LRCWIDEVGKGSHNRRKLPQLNQYRLTFSDEQGILHVDEVRASTMRLALLDNNQPFYLVKIERIDPETGAVLGGRYNE
jgi:hypothetical protein